MLPQPPDSATPQEIPPGTLEMLILRSLAAQPMHGYGIAQHIERLSGDVFRVEKGSLYPALDRVLRSGWATATWGTSGTGRRARYYHITPAGRRQLGEKRANFLEAFSAIQRILEG
ncbi:PadR family transcriptional regulator [Gemmatimonas aurantiaca]|uniref:PadR family transcriptional regulator n=1 Tax=Gemmatimonas aurantiaca TaxID=173480 RepID=UPI00301DFC60